MRGAVGAWTQEARQRALGRAPAAAEAELLARSAPRRRSRRGAPRSATRASSTPRRSASRVRNAVSRRLRRCEEAPAAPDRAATPIGGRRPRAPVVDGGDGHAVSRARKILQQRRRDHSAASSPPAASNAASRHGPRRHRPRIRGDAAGGALRRERRDQIGCRPVGRPGEAGDVQPGLDRQRRAAPRRPARAASVDAERRPRLHDDDHVAARLGGSPRRSPRRRRAAPSVDSRASITSLPGTAASMAARERVDAGAIRPDRAVRG